MKAGFDRMEDGVDTGSWYPLWTLLVILAFHTLLKAPYLGVPFTGDHSLKYNSYVEPALYMAEKGDPLWFQQKYTADPVFNPEGRKDRFNHLPLLEWGLFVAYKILPLESLELKTRIVTHLVGMGILILAYAFFSRWVPKNMALLAVFLLSINPLFVFSTFVTVQDSLAILFMFLSLLWMTGYLEGKGQGWLFGAGVAFGFGLTVKYSLFLWMAPISLVILCFCSRDMGQFLYASFILFFVGLTGILAMKTSVNILPAFPRKGFFFLAIWIIGYATIGYGISREHSRITGYFDWLASKRMILYPSVLAGFTAAFVVFRNSDLYGYTENFLTDMSLLTNLKLYKHMLWVQFRDGMTRNVFWLSLAGLLFALIRDDKQVRRLALALCLGSAVYWIIASKAMFLHDYYALILMITASFLAAVTIQRLVRTAGSTGEKIIVGFLLATLVLPSSYRSATARISRYEDITSAADFIRKETNAEDRIVYMGYMSPLVIYTGRTFIRPFRLVNDQIRNDIQRIGFAETMKKYRIRYFISPSENPTFLDFAPLFADTKLKAPGFDRDYIIQKQLGTLQDETRKAFSDLEQVVQDHRIREKFRFVAKRGNLRFYSFHD